MKLLTILVPVLIWITFNASAQKVYTVPNQNMTNLPNLSIGDQVPDFPIGKMINSSKKSERTGEYKNQLLIIDFWATSCSGCVEALPKMDSLQKQFGLKVKILPVTYEKEINALTFWKNNKNTKKLSLSSVVEDKIFASYFKHKTIPHEVWIYKGKVIGITSSDFVSTDNIQMVLNGQQINWPVKNDFFVFDASKGLLFNPDPNQVDTTSTFLKYAAISDYKEGVNAEGFGGSGIIRNKDKKTIRAFFLNYPVYNAYLSNWMYLINSTDLVRPTSIITPNQIVWEVLDKSKYTFLQGSGALQSWLSVNGICFESLNPDSGQTDVAVHRSIIADLDRLLGLHARWEKRKETVFVLVQTDKKIPLKSKHALTAEYDDRLITKGSLHQFRDSPLSTITSQMNQQADNPYVFDETGYTENVDIDLNFSSWTDIAAIKKALQAYGLDLRQEERLVDKFVFTETNGGSLVDNNLIIEAKARREAQKNMKGPSTEENNLFPAMNKKKPGVVTLSSGLQYKIIHQGKGAKPTLNDKVSVNYTATLVNGKIFDSSLERGIPYVITVGAGIKGWTEALQLMSVGSKWIVYIPADLAYGGSSNSGKIPPNSILIFEIELLQIIK
ncbi:FKBP-type peptidyl-prolyl cis-trans isomerase/thiol-disulfide isomerase/thioredoxin [Pedobacter cryoconitis]|uniref:peptidylprolyl isomerase n=1 Tax=Pedobacter cryoconitis TaxID=188932 RepID=A0A7W8YRT7_9SPHI|nr:FKBP-type peptidyl-prolyl cis-trans isomerase [Pedobacter cryoconitis]MBB5620641.1 FKBP-type peptidyl-prolyl cis-trans isomerase/thiol-disulfide isomerase/thioredoxin [Pedobacter cryoconitis]